VRGRPPTERTRPRRTAFLVGPRLTVLLGSSDTGNFSRAGGDTPAQIRATGQCNSGKAVNGGGLRGFGLWQLRRLLRPWHLRSGRLRALLPQHQAPNTRMGVYKARQPVA